MFKLEPLQEKTLKLFAGSPLAEDFYWTGGTLLAFLYLKHRKSEDIDFFSDSKFNYHQVIGFVESLKEPLQLIEISEKKIFDRWEFILTNKDNLRVEFVFYDFPKLKRREKWQGIYVDSLDDLAANKTMALFDRSQAKDLVDVYFLLIKKGYKISDLLKLAKRKFGLTVGESAFLAQTMKGQRDLDKIKYLLASEGGKAKDELIVDIKEYFNNQSAGYLYKAIE